jgi:SAM-dependent methyltransferase
MTEDGYFRTRFTPLEARGAVWRHVAAHLQRWVDADGAVLDLGAGYGDLSRAVRARRRVALDANPQLDELIDPPVEAVVGDVTDLSRFADGEFATVFASNLLEHLTWEAVDRCVAEVHRVLRPGGRFLVVQPNFRLAPRRYFDDYTHRSVFTDQSLRDRLAASGFEIEHVEARFLPLTMRSRLSWGHRLVPWYLKLPWRPFAGQMLVVARRS